MQYAGEFLAKIKSSKRKAKQTNDYGEQRENVEQEDGNCHGFEFKLQEMNEDGFPSSSAR